MSDHEKDFDDFPTFSAENTNRSVGSMIDTYRVESRDQWTAASGITTEIPSLFIGSTFWFNYEELIDDCLDLTVLETGKTMNSTEEQTCRRCDNEQGTPQSRNSQSRRWSQVFLGYVDVPFHQRSSDYFPLKYYRFCRSRRGNIEMIKWSVSSHFSWSV